MEELRAPKGAVESSAALKKVSPPAGALKIGFWALLAIFFLKTSMIHEVIWAHLGFNSKLVSIVLVVGLLAALASGRWAYSFKEQAGRYWILFGVWSIFSGALGYWPGGALSQLFLSYLPTNYIICLLAIALVTDLRSSRRAMLVMAWGACCLVLTAKLLPASSGGRFALDIAGGSISNPVDLGVHLLFVAGFAAYAAAQSKSWLLRIGLLGVVLIATQLSLQTGSRTAVVGVGAAAIGMLLWRTTARRFMTTAVIGTAVIVIAFSSLSGDLASRLTNFDTSSDTEAGGSAETRLELAKRGLGYAFQHPLFGVGFGMFTDFDSGAAIAEGRRGIWKNAHNSFVAVAAETGLVGFFFFAAPLFIVLKGLAGLEKAAGKSQQTKWIATLARYQILVIFVHCVVSCFGNFQYMFYLPIMLGLGVATISAGKREFAQAAAATDLTKVGPAEGRNPAYANGGAALRPDASGVRA